MKLKVVLDGLFTRVNGKPASNNMHREFFERYLTVFKDVEVIARCFDTEDPSAELVESHRIKFTEVPPFQGPREFVKNIVSVIKVIISECLDRESVVILRLPATIPGIVGILRYLLRRPFSIELVGDPLDAYSPESLRHPLAKVFQWIFYRSTKFLCKKAVACSYVTAKALQESYPSKAMFSYTSLSLPAEKFRDTPRTYNSEIVAPKLIMVAMMQNYYKGHDLAISAMKILVEDFNFTGKLLLVGDGPLRSELEDKVSELNLTDYISFYGKSSAGEEVLSLMDDSDLLILPSRQEGLPRVIIEGMARGMPCVCTNVGGTKELVTIEQILNVPLDATTLAKRIVSVLSDVTRLTELSAINLSTSYGYESSLVQKKREEFYSYIIDMLKS